MGHRLAPDIGDQDKSRSANPGAISPRDSSVLRPSTPFAVSAAALRAIEALRRFR